MFTMLRVAAISAACAVIFGCASTQLNYNTLDLAGTVGDIQTQQVLYNLSLLLDDPGAIPTHIDLSAGTASTTNSVSPTLTAPIYPSAQTLAQTVTTVGGNNAGVANEVQNIGARTAVGVSAQAQDLWSQSWSYDPVVDGDELRRLRALYKYALGLPVHGYCIGNKFYIGAWAKGASDCSLPFSNTDLQREYVTVKKSVSISYANNETLNNPVYCQDIGLHSTVGATNSKGDPVDYNNLTLSQFEQPIYSFYHKKDPNTGVELRIDDKGKIYYPVPDPQHPGQFIPNPAPNTQPVELDGKAWSAASSKVSCTNVMNSVQIPDENFLHTPSCILCLNSSQPTAIYTPASHLAVNPQLEMLRGGQSPWLYAENNPERPDDAISLGRYGKHTLYIRPNDKWKLSEFTLFILTATAQSAAANAANGTSGSQKKSSSQNSAPAQLVGPSGVQTLQQIGPGFFRQ